MGHGGGTVEMLVGRLPERNFWRGKKVFLTGHTGFKGGWMSLWLTAMGARVRGYALAPPTQPSLFAAARIADIVQHEIADIRDAQHLSASLKNFAPDIVIHMAAQPLVLYSYAQPVETYATNVLGTVHVLEAVRNCPSAAVTLIITTDKCYDNPNSGARFKETDRLGGHDPYSNSKACAELVTSAYAASYFFGTNQALASLRAGNVIGGGDFSPDRLMPDIFGALLQNRAPVLRAPDAVRPWQHVLEPLCGYLAAAEHLFAAPTAGTAWNFGPEPESEVTVGEIAARVCLLWGSGIAPVQDPGTARGQEARLLALDSTKATRELSWRPRWNLETALARTVSWHRAFAQGGDMREFTLNQIAGYTGAA